MTNLPLISVIVPVYNVEQYVEECVESLVAQDYSNLEIVVVDDGATDGSGAICDRFAEKYENVTVYHKENGGLSDARNYGLAHSHGEWISFVDSDDYVSSVFISTLYKAASMFGSLISAIPGGKDFHDGEACELAERIHLVSSQGHFEENGSLIDEAGVTSFLIVVSLRAQDILRKMLYQQIATGAPWRLYHRSILGENPFPRGLYYEDLASTYKFVYRAGQVALVDCRELYAYRIRRDSIIRQSYRHIKAESALRVSEQLYRDISEWYPELADAAASRCFSVCRMVFGQVPMGSEVTEETERDREALWSVLKRYRGTVLHDSNARRRERFAAVIACMGEGTFTIFCRLMRRLGKMR